MSSLPVLRRSAGDLMAGSTVRQSKRSKEIESESTSPTSYRLRQVFIGTESFCPTEWMASAASPNHRSNRAKHSNTNSLSGSTGRTCIILIMMRMIHVRPVLPESEFVFECFARFDRWLGEAADAIHSVGQNDSVPMNTCRSR